MKRNDTKEEKAQSTELKTPTVNISREEWDFGSCPKEETLYCAVYEIARDNKEIQKAVKHLLKTGHWVRGTKLFVPHPTYTKLIIRMFELFTEFPNTPYLCIPAKTRENRCAELTHLRKLCSVISFNLN